jgi:hypothetical protein
MLGITVKIMPVRPDENVKSEKPGKLCLRRARCQPATFRRSVGLCGKRAVGLDRHTGGTTLPLNSEDRAAITFGPQSGRSAWWPGSRP